MLGAAAGVLFGVSDVAIKALTGSTARRRPPLAVAGRHDLASVVAFYASARGLQDGEAVPVIAATSTAANVSCILGGIVVFGDPMPRDTVGIAVQAFAFALVVVAALVTPPPMRAAEAAGLALALRPTPAAAPARPASRVVPCGHVPAAVQVDVVGVREPAPARGAWREKSRGDRALPTRSSSGSGRVPCQLGPSRKSPRTRVRRRRRGSTRRVRRRDAPTGARSVCQAGAARATIVRRRGGAVETARVRASTPRA
jgi:hypothetical protein